MFSPLMWRQSNTNRQTLASLNCSFWKHKQTNIGIIELLFLKTQTGKHWHHWTAISENTHRIDRPLGMTSDAPKNAGIYVTCTCNVWGIELSRHFVGHRALFQVLLIHLLPYWQNLKLLQLLTKLQLNLLHQTLQGRVNQWYPKIQSSDWPKWRCTLWRNVNSCIFVRHWMSFQA